jgi:hypothetical protein
MTALGQTSSFVAPASNGREAPIPAVRSATAANFQAPLTLPPRTVAAMARRNARDCPIHPRNSRPHTGRTNPRAHPCLRSKDLPSPDMDLGCGNTGSARDAVESIRPVQSAFAPPGGGERSCRQIPPPIICDYWRFGEFRSIGDYDEIR